MKKEIRAGFIIAIMVVISLMPFYSCGPAPSKSQSPPPQQSQPSQVPQSQPRIATASYNGEPAIIFRVDDVARGQNEEAVEKIIQLFGRNNVPVDVGIVPHNDGRDSYDMFFLKKYLDAGLIDLSIHGNQHAVNEFDTTKSGISYQKLKSDLITARSQLQQYYGITPVAITVPYDFFNEEGYKAAQDAGFKIFSTQKVVEPFPSVLPVDYAGKLSEKGMSRLCTVHDVANWDMGKQKWGDIFTADPKNELFYAIDWGINNLGVAVVGIHPQAFLNATGAIDTEKLNKLDAIIKSSKQRAVITTFNTWYKYTSVVVIGSPRERKQKTPAFNGGLATIFRMDDAEKGVNEKIVEEIIKVFERNKMPLDVGIMPFSGGRNSYDMPFLLKYLDAGVIDISMHGYKNTFVEFDTKLSRATFNELPEDIRGCFLDAYGKSTYTPAGTNYADLKAGLSRSREQFKRYFGFAPVAFTVPYDSFNEDGYRAAQDAGFKIFCSLMAEETYPSVEPVDYLGHKDKNGMYRLPSIGDVADWDAAACQWGDILNLTHTGDSLHVTMQEGLKSMIGLAILRIHPLAFVDAANNPDPAKLNKLDAIIKYIIQNKATYGQIITFQSWYDYTSKQKPPQEPQ